MELYKELISFEIGKMIIENFENQNLNFKEIAELKSIQLLQKIKTIIQDDSLTDFECVEKIVCLFETTGISAEIRHDF